jgi:ribosomal protein L11 methyltransferase
MYWLEISVNVDGEAAEAVAEVLRPYAYADSVVFEQLGDQTKVDPEALEPTVNVKIYLPQEQDSHTLRQRIKEAFYHMNRLYPVAEPVFRKLEDEDWATAWRKNYQPFQVGETLWIQPSWQAADGVTANDTVITLDPGMAFGTGLHPTTQMCLQTIEQEVRPGHRIVDIGTGSGILAIAAVKLGAHYVVAFDKERQAVIAARENALRNNVANSLLVFQGTLAALKPQPNDLLLVNILAPVIIALLNQGQLMNHIGDRGKAILSGIIVEQAAEVALAVAQAGGIVSKSLTSGDWVCMIMENKRTP